MATTTDPESVRVRANSPSPYAGMAAAVGTVHGKERQLEPALRRWHDMHVVPTRDLDTDRWGTFTGEVSRPLPPAEAAQRKAEAAAAELGTPLGIGTEASFASVYGFGPPVHEEILVFIDGAHSTRIIETHRRFAHIPPPRAAATPAEARVVLSALGFPTHGAVVRAATGEIVKGVRSFVPVERMLTSGPIIIEADLRAHMNPTRQRVIRLLAWRLSARLRCHCPVCDTPGYGIVGIQRGLPCAHCGAPTSVVRADIWGCAACPEREERWRSARAADPGRCDACNPDATHRRRRVARRELAAHVRVPAQSPRRP